MPDVERLDRRPEPWADPVRALMDEWFSHLHADAQKSIRPRFTSPRRDAHLGAFHELYQHELAVRGGYDDVDRDIGREDPQHLRPDLLLSNDRGVELQHVDGVLADVMARREVERHVAETRGAADTVAMVRARARR